MKTVKQIKEEFKATIAGVPGRTIGSWFVKTVGTKFLTVVSLYEGGRTIKIDWETYEKSSSLSDAIINMDAPGR